MKKVNFGEKTFEICENEFDINDGRFMVFKQYFKQLQTKEDFPTFLATFEKWKSLINKGNNIEANFCWYDYAKMIYIGDNYDAMEYCFALICLYENEDQTKTDENYLKEKLNYLRANGLTRGQVRSEVENFISASPELLLVYIVMEKAIQTLKELNLSKE